MRSYERRTDNRTTILARIETLRAYEPWAGYDEQTVDEIRTALGKADDATTKAARDYERAHKNRAGVLEAAAARARERLAQPSQKGQTPA